MALEFSSVAQPAVSPPRPFFSISGRRTVKVQERMIFTERLALLLETGVPLHAALKTLQEQTNNPALAKIIAAMLLDVLEGKAFSTALSMHTNVFPGTYVNLIGASETGGFMHQVLQQLVEMDEKQERLTDTIRSALAYPVFLIAFSLAVVVFVLVTVFPKFADLFASIRDQLPPTTLALMWMSDMLRGYWYFILTGIGGAVLLMIHWMRQSSGTEAIDRAKLSLPVVKDIFAQIYLSQLMRVMSVSLGNGVSVVDTLVACRSVIRNSVFRHLMLSIERQVNEGKGIAAGFRDAQFIPPIVKQMIATGDETGNLAKVMGRVADFYDRELTKRITTLAKLAEPIMLLIMGAVIGLIVSSLILPIFKLSRAVH